MSLLQSLKSFELNSKLLEAWYEEFIDVVQAQIQNMFLTLVSTFLEIAGLGSNTVSQSEPSATLGKSLYIEEDLEDWGLAQLLLPKDGIERSSIASAAENDNQVSRTFAPTCKSMKSTFVSQTTCIPTHKWIK